MATLLTRRRWMQLLMSGSLPTAQGVDRWLTVSLSHVLPGQVHVVELSNAQIHVWHRLPADIAAARAVPTSSLRDPADDQSRCQVPQWLVVSTRCTHLGCPVRKGGSFGGWWCRCHGSEYDTAGRVREGPAERNLAIPDHELIGADLMKLRF